MSFLLAALLSFGAEPGPPVHSPDQPTAPIFATAWLYLGDVNANREWVTQIKHVIRRRQSETHLNFPRQGDVLEVSEEVELVILGYTRTGTREAMVYPGGRVLTRDDLTGIKLPRGTLVCVRAVRLEAPVYRIRGVWVRVEPDE